MDLRDLNYFLTVAREQNITRAAKKLNMSQPPLSRQLQLLEEELGVQLLVRGKRQVTLTDEGKYLAAQAEQILSMAKQTSQHLATLKTQDIKGTLTIGVTETCSASILPDVLPEFQRLYPLVDYNIWCGNSNDVAYRVREGLMEIGFIREPFNKNDFDAVHLQDETWLAVVSKDHPLAHAYASTQNLALADLCREPLFIPSRQPLQDELQQWLTSAGVPHHIQCLYNQIASIIPLIIAGMGVAISPGSVMNYTDSAKLDYIPITDSVHLSRLFMIRRRHGQLSRTGEVFWKHVVEHVF